MDCSSITDFQQSTAIGIAKKFGNLHIGQVWRLPMSMIEWLTLYFIVDNNQEMHATEEDLQAIAQIEESEAGGQKMMTMTTYPNLKPLFHLADLYLFK